LNIYNYRISLAFDNAVIDFSDIDIAGSLSAAWKKPLILDYGNSVTITAFGQTPLFGQGKLIFINFNVIGSETSSSAIHISNMTVSSSNVVISITDGTIIVEGTVPVELSSFMAEQTQGHIILKWTTLSETLNYGFYIQRKFKADQNWEEIGFVKGWGTTAVQQSYQFIDNNAPAGALCYRLKQQDLDGAVIFSQVIEIDRQTIYSYSLYQNYPNPFNSSTTILYELQEDGLPVSILIYNLNGNVVKNLINKAIKRAGYYQASWDGCDETGNRVSSGMYYYQMQVADKKFSRKMILVE
jgi:hypothetical protein